MAPEMRSASVRMSHSAMFSHVCTTRKTGMSAFLWPIACTERPPKGTRFISETFEMMSLQVPQFWAHVLLIIDMMEEEPPYLIIDPKSLCRQML